MPFRKFRTKKGDVPRKDQWFDREMPNPMEKPEPAKKKATKLRIPGFKSGKRG